MVSLALAMISSWVSSLFLSTIPSLALLSISSFSLRSALLTISLNLSVGDFCQQYSSQLNCSSQSSSSSSSPFHLTFPVNLSSLSIFSYFLSSDLQFRGSFTSPQSTWQTQQSMVILPVPRVSRLKWQLPCHYINRQNFSIVYLFYSLLFVPTRLNLLCPFFSSCYTMYFLVFRSCYIMRFEIGMVLVPMPLRPPALRQNYLQMLQMYGLSCRLGGEVYLSRMRSRSRDKAQVLAQSIGRTLGLAFFSSYSMQSPYLYGMSSLIVNISDPIILAISLQYFLPRTILNTVNIQNCQQNHSNFISDELIVLKTLRMACCLALPLPTPKCFSLGWVITMPNITRVDIYQLLSELGELGTQEELLDALGQVIGQFGCSLVCDFVVCETQNFEFFEILSNECCSFISDNIGPLVILIYLPSQSSLRSLNLPTITSTILSSNAQLLKTNDNTSLNLLSILANISNHFLIYYSGFSYLNSDWLVRNSLQMGSAYQKFQKWEALRQRGTRSEERMGGRA